MPHFFCWVNNIVSDHKNIFADKCRIFLHLPQTFLIPKISFCILPNEIGAS